MRNIIRMAGAAVLAATALLATLAPAQAADLQRLGTRVNTGMCLDVPFGNFSQGQEMWTESCSRHIAQRFVYTQHRELKPEGNTGLCLDIPDSRPTPGANVRLWKCNGSDAQKWLRNVTAAEQFMGLNGKFNLCLDVAGGSPAARTNVITWTCDGGRPQQWFWK